jgi:hypothetical protein
MSDFSQGAGWWQASDGKWYAPELHPNFRPPPPPNPAPPPPPQAGEQPPWTQPAAPQDQWSQTGAPQGQWTQTGAPQGQWTQTGAPQGQWTQPGPAAAAVRPAFNFDAKRWTRAQIITGAATLVLFISLFLPWFSYNFDFGSVSVDGLWHGWMYLVLLISIAVIAWLIMGAGYETRPFEVGLSDEQILLIATGINLVLTLIAFLDKPGGGFSGIQWGFGAVLGVIAAIVAVAPLGIDLFRGR